MYYCEYVTGGFDSKMSVSGQNKKVKCLNTDEVFLTIKSAATKYVITSASIVNCLKGKTKTSARLHWCYA